MLANRLLNTATVTRGNFQCLTQRYLLFDSIYVALTNCGRLQRRRRREWEEGQRSDHDTNAKDLALLVEKHVSILERNIKEIEHEIGRTSKMVYN